MITKPKKAYKKTSGLSERLADLAVFYCESCMNLYEPALGYCGMDAEDYFNAFLCLYEQALKAILAPEGILGRAA